MGKRIIPQHEPLRVPNGWTEQARAFVIQLERIIDRIYAYVSGGLARRDEEIEAVKSRLIVEKKSFYEIDTVGAGAVKMISLNVAKTGYTPIGIVTAAGNGTTGLVMQEFYISENSAVIYYRNMTSSAITPTMIAVSILYSRN